MEPEKIFFEIHSNLPREGPGNAASSIKALEALTDLPPSPRILDVGCGPGEQTLLLAEKTGGRVVAVDTHDPFLEVLKEKADRVGLGDQIQTENQSMSELRFPDGSFDLIWSEGAIYVMGFEEGLKAWKPLLAPGGYLAVTHISWFDENPPDEPRKFWEEAYPAIRTVEENLAILTRLGYTEVAHFPLPEAAWWDEYYNPMEQRITELREKYRNDSGALSVLSGEYREIELFRKYSDCYGYAFFVMRKAD